MSLKIVAVPTDPHGETNLVYTNPSDSLQDGSIIDIGGFYFTVKQDPLIEKGAIAMNLMQRKCAKVSTQAGDRATIPPAGFHPPEAVLANVKFGIQYVAASKKGGLLDYVETESRLHTTFGGQYLKVGQMLLVVIGGTKYIATVETLDAVGEKGSDAQAGTLRPETTIALHLEERCEIQFTNVPAKIEDESRAPTVKDFNLEALGIGGLRAEFAQVFRRAFASRIFPQSIVKRLGLNHVKGLLLHGPPGTGKTLIARKIGEILNCKEPKIVNGPEIFSKYVGQAEENVRKLFADAEAEQAAKGDKSGLHLIIFDEFDAICKQRGAVRDSTGVSDNVVNQLLSKIDGVNKLNNVLLIGMTNRKDLIDEAILRPGRFEVHVEIGLPDENGRVEIMRIHTAGMVKSGVLADDVNLKYIAAHTKNFSGAELEGLVRSAQSHAFSRHVDFDNPTQVHDADNIKINMSDFNRALEEVKPALGRAQEECEMVLQNGIIHYGDQWHGVNHRITEFTRTLATSPKMHSLSVLFTGPAGTGKSAVAAHMAMSSDFPYVKYLTSDNMVGYGEAQKANLFRKAFDDAHKSPLSVVVLDDIERLVEYSRLGQRYSNVLLQTLMVLIKRPPPEGKKILVIGTATNSEVMEALEIQDCFSARMELPMVPRESLELVVKGVGAQWETSSDSKTAMEAMPDEIAIKRLIFLIEMAAVGTAASAGNAAVRKITADRFVDALLSTGS